MKKRNFKLLTFVLKYVSLATRYFHKTNQNPKPMGSIEITNQSGGKTGTKRTRIVIKNDGKVVEETVEVRTDEGKEIPKGGFRGGAEDVPTGHQSGYGGHSEPSTPKPDQVKEDEASSRETEASRKHEKELHKMKLDAERERAEEDSRRNEAREEREDSRKRSTLMMAIILVLIGAGIVWFSWFLFVCSDCMSARLGSQNETEEVGEVLDGDDNLWNGNDGEYIIPPTENNPVVTEPVINTDPDPKPSYGKYTPASGSEVYQALLEVIRDSSNFRFLPKKLDGVEKFAMLAAITATDPQLPQSEMMRRQQLVQSNTGVFVSNTGQRSLKAWSYGAWAKYISMTKAPTSFNWWANANVEEAPGTNETDYSRAVHKSLENLEEELETRGITIEDLLKGNTLAMSTSTSKGRSVKNAPSKGGVTSSVSTTVLADFYQNPVPGATWNNKHWDGKSHAVDMMAKKGTPVYAASNGVVIRAGLGGKKSGKRVTIRDEHADIFYGHLDQVLVKTGQRVRKGQQIGTVGHTGSAKASAPHLHLEVLNIRKGSRKDFPKPWHKWAQGNRRRT
jgi:murein DD-endopeptidase MepM/ murein hydrolase activator NlpD